MKIIQELKILVFGMQNGLIKIFKWPFNEFNENTKLKSNMIYEINLHTGPVIDLFVTNNLKYLITASRDGSIYYSELFFDYLGTLKPFYLLGENDKLKPKIEVFLGLNEIFQYKTNHIRDADSNADRLKKKKKLLEKHNMELIDTKTNDHLKEINSLEEQVNLNFF